MVFEKFEGWAFETPPAGEVFTASWAYWQKRGYQLRSTGPASFQGRSFHSKLGIHRVVDITVQPAGSGARVDIRFRADVRSDVAAGGVVVAVLLLPVAVAGAAISWHEYERDWSQERWDYHEFLTGSLAARRAPGGEPPPRPSSPLLPPPPGPPPPPPPDPGPSGGGATAPPTTGPQEGGGGPRPRPGAEGPTAPPLPRSAGRGASGCPACGAATAGEGKFCASCGAAMPSG